MDTSFLNSWNDDLKKENDRKVGHPYEYPQEFFIFLSKSRAMECSIQGTGRIFQETFRI
ncbi:MAG: hypothetical protein QXU98_05615 [Candidatus Parvarchaeota archaeon]